MKKLSLWLLIPFFACASIPEKTGRKDNGQTNAQIENKNLDSLLDKKVQTAARPIDSLLHENVESVIQENEGSQTSEKNQVLTGSWRIAAYFQHYSEIIVDSTRGYAVQIDEPTGRISGRVCNQMSGSFKAEEGNGLKIGPLMSTKMMCPEMQTERNVFSAFQQANRFSFEKQDLVLYQNEIPLLRLVKFSKPGK